MLQINVRTGELASPTVPLPLVVLGDVSALRVRAELDERDYGDIKVGHPVVVRTAGFPGRNVAGKVSSIAPIVSPDASARVDSATSPTSMWRRS